MPCRTPPRAPAAARRRRATRTAATAAATAASLVLLSGCSGWQEWRSRDSPSATAPSAGSPVASPTASPEPEPAPERLDRLTSGADLARADPCGLVAPELVRSALGVPSGQSVPGVERTAPGDTVEVEVGGEGVAVPVSEYGCSWTLRTGPAADLAPGDRAAVLRVFAPPVSSDRAQELAVAARSTDGCEDLPGTAFVGSPGVALDCGAGELRLEGLVGDAWVACGLTRPDLTDQEVDTGLAPEVLDWCAATLEGLDAAE